MYGMRGSEKCIVHDIEKGNTLYGISKMYAVTVENITDSNPWAKEGLSIGETLFIPVKYVDAKEAKTSPKLDGHVLTHRVKKRETLYSLSKRYNIDMNDLLEANPGTMDGLKKGMTVLIPTDRIKKPAAHVTPAVQDSLISHLVGTGETLYSISKMYEVEIDELKDVNRGLPEGLKKGERIRIPKFRDGYVSTSAATPEIDDSEKEENTFASSPQAEVKVGLMLPFAINSINNAEAKKGESIMKMTDISFEFYRGVELALQDLSEKGMSAQVHVFDVDRQEKSVNRAMDSPGVDDLDLIIGPVFLSSYTAMAKKAESMQISSVSPFTSKSSILKGNKLASKVTTAPSHMASYMAKYMFTKYEGDTIILFKSGLEKDKAFYASFMKGWNEMKQGSDSTAVLIEFSIDAYEEEKFLPLLSTARMNPIAVPSSQRPFVSDLTTKLRSSAMSELDITVYGLESWLKFENIDADLKNRFNMRIVASKYLDYEDAETKKFISSFYAQYGTVPSPDGYGLMGYDIASYYLKGIYEHGEGFTSNLDQFKAEGLETGFDFHRVEGGGWENRHCFVLRYEDYELMREN
jgi:LysM repeat protein